MIFGGLYFWLILPLNWQTISGKKHPEGVWVAYHIQSMSEAGEAPYGDHLVLAQSYWPLGQYYGEVVFAGYCTGGLQYRWLDAHQLHIECNAERVLKRIDAFEGVRIQYDIVKKTLHNNAPPPTQ